MSFASIATLSGCGKLWIQINASNCVPGGTYSSYGQGSPSNPYLICDGSQLYSLANSPSGWGASYQMTANIDMTSYPTMTPIGVYNIATSTGTPFTGNFNGAGFTINNLQIDMSSTTSSAGLFGYTSGATINNLNLKNVQILGVGYMGGLVGYNVNSQINNASVQGSVTQTAPTYMRAGGLVGYNSVTTATGNSDISNASTSVTLVGFDSVGGLVGGNYISNGGQGNITNCSANSTITQIGSSNTFGGLIGINNPSGGSQATVSNSSASGSITLTSGGSFSSGFIGTVIVSGTGDDSSVTNSYSTVSITDPVTFNAGYLGGFYGIYNCYAGGSCNTSNSYYNGSVTLGPQATSGRLFVGGFAGRLTANSNLNISNCYVTGSLNLNNSTYTTGHVGGFIGESDLATGVTVDATAVYSNMSISGNYQATSTGEFIGDFSLNSGSSFSTSGIYYNSSDYATGVGTTSCSSCTTAGTENALTSTSIVHQASYSPAFNFSTVWQINEGVSPPTLR